MKKRLLLFFGLFLMQSGYGLDCALACFGKKARRQQNQLQVARPEQAPIQNSDCAEDVLKMPEDCMDIVAQKTRFPNVVSQLVAGYLGYRVKKMFPAQESVCVEHVMPDGRLVCVTRDGRITTRDLLTNKVLQSFNPQRNEREVWCTTRPITSLGNDHIAIDFDAVYFSKTKAIDIIDVRTIKRATTLQKSLSIPRIVDSIVLQLLKDQFLIGYKNCGSISVLTIGHGEREIEGPGYDDIVRLSDNRLAAARNGIIMFSSIEDPLEALPGHNLKIFSPGTESLEKLIVFPDDRLAVVSQLPGSMDARLRVVDLTTRSEILRIEFEREEKIDVAALADGDIAVRKHRSREVEVIYANGLRETLPLGKRAVAIQGLSNRDLFVKFSDGTKSMVTNKFD